MKFSKLIIPLSAGVLGLVAGLLLAPVVWMRPPDADAADPAVRRQAASAVDSDEVDEPGEEADGEASDGDDEFVEAVDADSVADDDEPVEVTVEEVRDDDGDGLTPEERAEKFKRENPEEWERIQNRRKAMLAAMRKAAKEKQDFIDAIDDAYLTAEQRKEHAAFAEALATRNASRDRVRAAVDAGKDPSPDDLRALSGAERTLHEKAEDERKLLLEATARSLGLEKDDVADFVGVLDGIDTCTRDLH